MGGIIIRFVRVGILFDLNLSLGAWIPFRRINVWVEFIIFERLTHFCERIMLEKIK